MQVIKLAASDQKSIKTKQQEIADVVGTNFALPIPYADADGLSVLDPEQFSGNISFSPITVEAIQQPMKR